MQEMKEHIEAGGYDFYIIYGPHDHGYYIAIPNWGVCVEAAEPDNVFYNEGELFTCPCRTVAAHAGELARAIDRHYSKHHAEVS